jgi:hypothetical protein
MNKSIRLIVLLAVLISLLLAAVIPAAAQDLSDPRGVCINIAVTTSTGEYIYVFLDGEQFNDVWYGGVIPDIVIEVTAPGSTLSYTLILPPEAWVVLASPDGYVDVLYLEGWFDPLFAGAGSWQEVSMVTDCLNDGRLNLINQAMLAVIYRDGLGGYDIWRVDPATSNGTFDYNVTRAQVDAALAAADAAGQPQVIASGATSTLYALGNGECQLNGPSALGEMQEFIFTCGATS